MFTDDVKPQKQETAGKREMEVKHKRRGHRQTVATTLAQPQTQKRDDKYWRPVDRQLSSITI